MSLITAGEAALMEHKLNVARTERGWQIDIAARANRRAMTPAPAEWKEARPKPLGVALAQVLNGSVFAVVAAWMKRLFATTPDGLRSKEHELAAMGMRWTSDPAEDERLAEEMRQACRQRAENQVQAYGVASHPSNVVDMNEERVIRTPVATDRYPYLSMIDLAREDGQSRFAEDPDAARLERLARAMTEQFWSETAWVTGFIPERAFNFVCEALERQRSAVVGFGTEQADLGTAA